MNIREIRQFHRQVAPIILLPFLITAMTGVAYRLGRSWFGLSRDQAHWLMEIHQGDFLGKQLEPIYVFLNGLGLLFMLATGIGIWINSLSKSGWFRAWRSPSTEETSE